jgi:hypothetical protein
MDQISKAAEFIADLRFALRQEPQIPEFFRPDNPDSGYAVQEAVVDRLLKKYGGSAVGSGEKPLRHGATSSLRLTRSVSGSTVRKDLAAQELRFWATL